MDEEIKRTMDEFAEGMRQLAEAFGTQSKFMNEKFEKDKQFASWQEEDHKREKANSKEAREAEIKHLGYYRDELGIIKESVDLRKSENQQKKEAIAQIKKDVGEEAFLRKQQQKLLADELDKIEQNNSAYATMARNAALAAKAMAAPGEAIRTYTTQHGKQLDSFGSMVGATTDKMYDMAKGSAGWTMAVGAAEAATHLLVGSLMGAYKSFEAIGKGLLNGERGMSLAAQGVSARAEELGKATDKAGSIITGLGASAVAARLALAAMGGPIGWVTVAIGTLATVLGLGIKTYGEYQKKFAEVNSIASSANDKLYNGFNELGKMSMTSAGGMEDLAEQTHKLGMAGQVEKFTALIARSSKEIKTFGVTAAEGLKHFTEVSTELFNDKASKMFERMGITLEEQYEHTAKYMALQNRLGLTQEKTAAETAKSAKLYMEELEKTAELTGATRKEQEDARNVVMSMESGQAALLDEQRKLAQGDRGAEARIEQIGLILKLAAEAQAKGQTETAKGLADTAAGNASVEALQVQRAQAGVLAEIKKGEKDLTYLTVQMHNAGLAQARDLAGTRRITGDAKSTYGLGSDSSASYTKLNAELTPLNKLREAEKKRLGDKFDEKTFIKEQGEKALAAGAAKDASTNKQIDIRREESKEAGKLDDAALKFLRASDANTIAVQRFSEAIKTLEDFLGDKKSTGAPATPAYGTTAGGAAFGNPKLARQGQRGGATQAPAASAQSLSDAGLILKKGDVQQSGAGVDPRLIEIAKQVQGIPGFKYFSAFNDGFHNENAPSSSHTAGRAFDFVLDKKPSKEEGQRLVAMLQGMGINYVQDEYNNPSSKATAGHIHAELKGARTGGVFSGPSSGYPVMLHGREAVVPQANVKDIKKETLSAATTSASPGSDEVVGLLADMVETMSDKLDQVINKLGDSNDIQGKILNYSMA